MFSMEGGGGAGSGDRVNVVITLSCNELMRGLSSLQITFSRTSEVPGVSEYNIMSRSESNRPMPTK